MTIRFNINRRTDMDLFSLYYGLGKRGFKQFVESSLRAFLLGENEPSVSFITPEFPETIPEKIEFSFSINGKKLAGKLDTVISGKKSQMIRNILRYYSMNRTAFIYFEDGFNRNHKHGKEGLIIEDKGRLAADKKEKGVQKEPVRKDVSPVSDNEKEKQKEDKAIESAEIEKPKPVNAQDNNDKDDLDTLMSMFGDI